MELPKNLDKPFFPEKKLPLINCSLALAALATAQVNFVLLCETLCAIDPKRDLVATLREYDKRVKDGVEDIRVQMFARYGE